MIFRYKSISKDFKCLNGDHPYTSNSSAQIKMYFPKLFYFNVCYCDSATLCSNDRYLNLEQELHVNLQQDN